MASETEVIRHEMEGTRSALAEKLERLEAHVSEKVQQAGSAVAETVESVTDTVEKVTETVDETVDTVKHTFDLNWHAEHHPWMLVGGAVVIGFLGTRLLLPGRPPHRRAERERQRPTAPPPPPPRTEKTPAEHNGGGLLSYLGQGVNDLKKLGIGMALGVAREAMAQALPEPVRAPVTQVMNSLTTKLGGEPLGVDAPASEPEATKAAQDEPHACGMPT
jgi:ElaB/YqjD/DUF883 family membrane-anchored ribosome-binding protein